MLKRTLIGERQQPSTEQSRAKAAAKKVRKNKRWYHRKHGRQS
jgi:hypothetical protein